MKKILLLTGLLLVPLTSFAGNFDSKIIGGTKAAFGSWPSTVALLDVDEIKKIETGRARDKISGTLVPVNQANYQSQFCGASLIAPEWVLTAAHCLKKDNKTKAVSKVTTLIGAYNLIGDGYRRDIEKIIIHPQYDADKENNDIALIKLKTRVNVDTIAVSSVDPQSGTLAFAVGWGDLDGLTVHYPSKLYEIELPVVDRSVCSSYFTAAGGYFTNNMLCAGYLYGKKRDVCNGDSGGPLMARLDNGGYKQIGITSWGASCTDPGSYGAYTRLSKYKSWINSIISPASSNEGGGSLSFLLLPFLLLLAIRYYRVELVTSNIK